MGDVVEGFRLQVAHTEAKMAMEAAIQATMSERERVECKKRVPSEEGSPLAIFDGRGIRGEA